jgi:hypothetical protein
MSRKSLAVAALVLTVVGFALHESTASAFQSSWSRFSNGCSSHSGFMTFCFIDGTYQNITTTRDSNLRSTTGGISDDKYLNNFIMGTVVGVVTNTGWVLNNFVGTTSVSLYGGTNCPAGTSYVTLAPGSSHVVQSFEGLMSFAASGAAC